MYYQATVEVCKPLRRSTLVKTEWMWMKIYNKLYDTAKAIIKKDKYMKFYNEKSCFN